MRLFDDTASAAVVWVEADRASDDEDSTAVVWVKTDEVSDGGGLVAAAKVETANTELARKIWRCILAFGEIGTLLGLPATVALRWTRMMYVGIREVAAQVSQ